MHIAEHTEQAGGLIPEPVTNLPSCRWSVLAQRLSVWDLRSSHSLAGVTLLAGLLEISKIRACSSGPAQTFRWEKGDVCRKLRCRLDKLPSRMVRADVSRKHRENLNKCIWMIFFFNERPYKKIWDKSAAPPVQHYHHASDLLLNENEAELWALTCCV